MMHAFRFCFAEGATRRMFEWGRIQTNADWVLPIAVCVALMLFVHYMYRRDAVDLPRPLGWFLTALRMAVILGLLILYLDPHWRLERDITRNSRVLVLVDTSLSMGLSDNEIRPRRLGEKRRRKPHRPSRRRRFEETDLLDQLRKTHDVSIFQFNDDLLADRSLTLPKIISDETLATLPKGRGGENPEKPIDWSAFLKPGGTETRLGQALRQLIHNERGAQLSGIVLISDGGQNAGIAPEAAVAMAQEMKLPIFTVGLGSDKRPINVRVSDLAVPARAYPGDKYTVTGYLQAQHMAGQVVTVELLSRPANSSAKEEGTGKLVGKPGGHARRRRRGDSRQIRTDARRNRPQHACASACKRRRATAIRPTISARRRSRSSIARITSCCWPADRCAITISSARCCSATVRRPWTCCCKPRSRACRRKARCSTNFPRPARRCSITIASWRSIPIGRPSTPNQIGLLETWVAEQGGGLIVVAGPVNAGKAVERLDARSGRCSRSAICIRWNFPAA